MDAAARSNVATPVSPGVLLPRLPMLIFALTIFLGALLLFQVELIIGKYILPWFGGTSSVWIACMLFFQVALVGGYAYGHLLGGANTRAQTRWHLLLLIVSLTVLAGQFLLWHSPLILDSRWKPQAQGNPLLQIVTLLTVSVGLPYLVLASTAPLLQSWWRRLYPHSSPYRLYAVSNFGSFLGLISYPFLVEPFLPLKIQARLWTWAYAAFALGCGYCAMRASRVPELASASAVEGAPESRDFIERSNRRPAAGVVVLWLGLAACASALFLATTNQLCKNVAAVPLLWVLPLALYLLTFTLSFESDRPYSRKYFHPAFALAVFLACFVLSSGARTNLLAQIAIYSLVLFAGSMVCHGELARLKPDPRHLTLFYLVVACGGVLGGLFVGLIAPYLFSGYWEYEVSLWLVVLLFLIALFRDSSSWINDARAKSPLVLLGAAALLPGSMAFAFGFKQLLGMLPAVGVIVTVLLLPQRKQKETNARSNRFMTIASCAIVLSILGAACVIVARAPSGTVASVRNFYGALTVDRKNASDPDLEAYALKHGEIVHGFELRAPGKELIPTSYYSTNSGLGLLFAERSHPDPSSAYAPAPQPLRVGAIGLGIGTIAAYGRLGDYIRFYEINPEVVRLASNPEYFQYLSASPARIDIVLGDARLSLERELDRGAGQNFDILVVDAFNGDAVPVHLLTVEAFELYMRHLRNSGVLAVHVTNTFLNLRPVVGAAAERLGLASTWIHSDEDKGVSYSSDWVLLSRDRGRIDRIAAAATHASPPEMSEARLWTDEYSNLFQAVLDNSGRRH